MPVAPVWIIYRYKDGRGRLHKLYIVGDRVYVPGYSIPLPLSLFQPPEKKKPAKPKPPEKPIISYSEFRDLFYAGFRDNRCQHCGSFPNPTIIVEVGGLGERKLVKCKECGRFMLPRS